MLIGKKAPYFKAKAVVNGKDIVEDFSLDQYIGKKYVIFFFYPRDFTFVCPTEIRAFQSKLDEFKKRDVEIVACSTDSEFSHWKWLQTDKAEGGIKGVTFPLVADTSLTISENFEVLAGEYDINEEGDSIFEGEAAAYRGLFLIDKSGIIRHMVINDMNLGRSVNETLRMVDALQYCEKHGEVCPADWQSGNEALNPTQEGISDYLKEM
ncbi:MAG: peroxiredoxin [Bacteroidales bacterium]|jgi:peroxiredoxin (alkyl hydroperoxide reductase subunit C)|nr:peroxiredoxin [Bacteroidales bacterium]